MEAREQAKEANPMPDLSKVTKQILLAKISKLTLDDIKQFYAHEGSSVTAFTELHRMVEWLRKDGLK
jgi:hypothetical protein